MTIQEYKEKVVHTIEQMEMEHKVNIESVEVDKLSSQWLDSENRPIKTKWNFKMVVK